MVPHLCLGFSANSAHGWIQRGAKYGGGVPSRNDFFFRLEGYSNKPNAWQWSKRILEEALLFLDPFWSQMFDVFLDLVNLPYFNAISIDSYAVKCFICIFLCYFYVYKWENAYIKDLLYAWRILMIF